MFSIRSEKGKTMEMKDDPRSDNDIATFIGSYQKRSGLMTDNDMIWTDQLGPINLDLFKSKYWIKKLNFCCQLKYKKHLF